MNRPKTLRKTSRSKEETVHSQVAKYLKLKYPNVIFRTDYAAGLKLNIIQAVIHKSLQSEGKYPDLFIAEPRNGFAGLYLELKRDIEEILKKDGTLKRKMVPIYKTLNGQKVKVGEYDHIAEQQKMLKRLTAKGYKAMFACGFDHAVALIDNYLK